LALKRFKKVRKYEEKVEMSEKTPSKVVLAGEKRAAIKVFNFEKTKRKEKRPRCQRPENLIRRAGGLKDLKFA
jgi:hypothetical protein